jgi:hypothetical protein
VASAGRNGYWFPINPTAFVDWSGFFLSSLYQTNRIFDQFRSITDLSRR